MQDAQSKPDPAAAMGLGGVAGGVLGGLAMPGGVRTRMAGGLVGAILGGGLGGGIRNMMVQSSPAGNMLAKLQASGGQMNAMDRMQLESVLKDIYNNPR
jgi:outer membrane lipoprotein SlyB